MENSGALLCQISALKDMLDQVNEEIEANIERTREIESEMVKCSEIDKGLLTKESEFTKMISMQEFEINGLIQVAAVASTSLELMKKDMSCLRMNLEEILKRKNEYREKFIVLCGNFQRDIVKGETEELWALLLDKEVLENEKFILNMKINALRNSTSAFVEEILEELHNSNSVLQVEVQCGNSENNKLLKDIDDLKNSLLALNWFKDSSCNAQSHPSCNGL
ncbi:uncharacterized protein LOC131251240 isoform X1 [Magnolia sinica]|uniref:uncharacterized protein LOC131251240 isoform X1 n=1 Tax=Magnolia sinica TaxID=86752 RepID=UPI00265B342B|nr:uncharacterized protein LOC131251240 isoform X1 [Magnolia sinica]